VLYDRSGKQPKRRDARSVARDVSETLAAMANADGGVWGSLVLQFLSILKPVHDGKKVKDIGLPIRLAQEFPQFPSKKIVEF
jgi:hypothetical protein